MPEVMDKERFRSYLLGAVEQVGENLGPDEDWAPILICLNGEAMVMVPLMSEDGDDLTRDLPALTALISKVRPIRLGRVGMGWASTDLSDKRPISEREEREEVLVVQIVEPGEPQEVWMGKVKRSEDSHPVVESWMESDMSGGAMVEVIQAAVEHAHRSN